MDVATALPRVVAENLRVSRQEFGAVWERAERIADATDPDEGYISGAVLAFRWVAGQTGRSPVTREFIGAMPETLDTELLAAHTRSGAPGQHPRRVDVARGAAAALGWAWGNGPLPRILSGGHGDRASTGSSS